MRQLELRPAYTWDCEECGIEQFERAILVELSAEELLELRREHGIDSRAAGDFVRMPDEVTCTSCGTTFTTKHIHSDD